jgi:hypothetical protein
MYTLYTSSGCSCITPPFCSTSKSLYCEVTKIIIYFLINEKKVCDKLLFGLRMRKNLLEV